MESHTSTPLEITNTRLLTCSYWDCRNKDISEKSLCEFHLQGHSLGLVDECLSCGRTKNAKYQLCAICNKREYAGDSSLVIQATLSKKETS